MTVISLVLVTLDTMIISFRLDNYKMPESWTKNIGKCKKNPDYKFESEPFKEIGIVFSTLTWVGVLAGLLFRFRHKRDKAF